MVVNLGWALWALVGGGYFLASRDALGNTTLQVFDRYLQGYAIVGWSLVLCGLLCLFSVGRGLTIQRIAAMVCAVWSGAVAVILFLATPAAIDQSDIDAWLLVMCAFTSMMRWALLLLEPHVCR